MARVSLRKLLLRGVSFTAAGALTCLIFILLTSFTPPQDAGATLPEAVEVEGEDKDGFPPPPPADGRDMVIRVFLQGYYINDGDKKLRRARDLVDGHIVPRWQLDTKSDEIIVRLHDKHDYNNVLHTVERLTLLTSGYTTEFRVPQTVNGTPLDQVWVSVRHRNHLETVWHELVDITFEGFQQERIVLDFTTAANRAYGSNQAPLSGGVFGIYGGDMAGGPDGIQDGAVDGDDLAAVYNHGRILARGYLKTDINGDGQIDGDDLALVYNAGRRLTVAITPP